MPEVRGSGAAPPGRLRKALARFWARSDAMRLQIEKRPLEDLE